MNAAPTRPRWVTALIAVTCLLAALLVAGGSQNATGAAPDDHRSVGRADTCTTSAAGVCTIQHGLSERPAAVVVSPTSPGFTAAVVSGVTAHAYSVTFYGADGEPRAATELAWYAILQYGPTDTTAPDTTISSGPEDGLATDVEFVFTSDDPDATFQCRLDDGEFETCTSPKALIDVPVGEHTFQVRATDLVGNVDESPASHAWEVIAPDTTAPETTITSGPDASTEATEATFVFESSEAGSTFECKLDAGNFETCTTPKAYTGLAPGAHLFSVRATDAAANTDLTAAEHPWTITDPVLRPSWQPTGTPVMEFQDEFNDTAVDTTKWERGWFGEGLTDNVNSSNDNCYHTSQVTESGGSLHLKAIAQPNFCKGQTRPYTSGMVTTRGKATFHEGSFEARVCLPDADPDGAGPLQPDGLVDNFPAWWVNGMASNFTDGEIDIVEGIGGGRTKATVHYGTDPGHSQHGLYSVNPLAGCHNFGAEWRGTDLKFYWDGALHFDTTISVPSNAQLVLVLNQAVDDSRSPTVVPAGGNDMTVDWVRVWQ